MNHNRNIFKLLLFILLVCFTAGCQQGTSGDQPSPVTQTTDSIKQQTDLSQSQQVNELKSQNDMLLQRSRFTTGGVAMILGIVALLAFLAFNSRWTRRIEIKNRQLQRERNVVIAQNKQLAIERDRAEAASKAKTAFIRSMTHEIRTPLNAISGFSQVLILDGDALEADERLDMFIRISDGIRRLTNILDDLILISDYESRTDVLPADDCVISTVISQAIHNVKPMVPKGSTMLRSLLPKDISGSPLPSPTTSCNYPSAIPVLASPKTGASLSSNVLPRSTVSHREQVSDLPQLVCWQSILAAP